MHGSEPTGIEGEEKMSQPETTGMVEETPSSVRANECWTTMEELMPLMLLYRYNVARRTFRSPV